MSEARLILCTLVALALPACAGRDWSDEVALVPMTDADRWVGFDDYPLPALRAGQQGQSRLRLRIGRDGVPRSCDIVESSGHAVLDEAGCTALRARARFRPPVDLAGNPVEADYVRAIRWSLPKIDAPEIRLAVRVRPAGDRFECEAERDGVTRRLADQLCQAIAARMRRENRSWDRPETVVVPDTPDVFVP